jgi:hypothetical protein
MHKFLDEYNQPKLNQEEISHLIRPITRNDIKGEIKNLSTKKSPGPIDSQLNFTKLLMKN